MTTYPPDRHILRDLRLTFDQPPDGTSSRARLQVAPELCDDTGHCRAGVLAVLVDVMGGGLAAVAAAPNWMATADLSLHLTTGAPVGTTVHAVAGVLRAGRTTIVLEVGLRNDDDAPLGIATMSFSVLPRRADNPEIDSLRRGDAPDAASPSQQRWSGGSSGMPAPIVDALGTIVIDAATGATETPVTDWVRNSMGALQGGVVATLADVAAETAARAATGAPLVVRDMHVSYLGFGRVGPVRSRADVLLATPERAVARVELRDAGADDRLMTVVSATATRAAPNRSPDMSPERSHG